MDASRNIKGQEIGGINFHFCSRVFSASWCCPDENLLPLPVFAERGQKKPAASFIETSILH